MIGEGGGGGGWRGWWECNFSRPFWTKMVNFELDSEI